ncbi:MAG: hypothetical protein ACE5FP_10365, partial [Gemmatimonadota bacterium]
HNQARVLRVSLEQFRVSVVLGGPQAPVNAAAPVADFIAAALRGTADAFLVERDGELVGIVTVGGAGEVPRDRRAVVPVFEIMIPLAELPRMSADTPLTQAAELLRPLGNRPALVEADGHPPRTIQMADIIRWVDRLQALGG